MAVYAIRAGKGTAASPGRHHLQARARHLLLPQLDRFRPEAAHHQRRLHGLKRHPVRADRRLCILRRFERACRIHRQIAHLQHLFDRRNPGDRVFAELPDAIRQRSKQLVPDIHRAAAHPRHNACVLGLGAVQLRQDHVVPRSARSAQHAQNLHLHGLRLVPAEDRPRRSHQPAMHLAEREEPCRWWQAGPVGTEPLSAADGRTASANPTTAPSVARDSRVSFRRGLTSIRVQPVALVFDIANGQLLLWNPIHWTKQ